MIGGVDIGGQTLLKAVKLIRSDEVHLTAEAGAIAHEAQVMREGRDSRRELCAVVIGGNARDMLARHKAEPRGRAQRRIAIGRIKARTARRKGIYVGCLHQRMTVCPGEMRGELIGHDENDVWLGHRGVS